VWMCPAHCVELFSTDSWQDQTDGDQSSVIGCVNETVARPHVDCRMPPVTGKCTTEDVTTRILQRLEVQGEAAMAMGYGKGNLISSIRSTGLVRF
jgi:hypothetical protein